MENTHGICTLSIVPIRSEAKHSSEMISQILYGETCEILETEGNFSKIKMDFDGYEGWVNSTVLKKQNAEISKIENLITEKTKAIVVVHYAGVAVDMDIVMELAAKYNLFVIEDAAQAIDSYYKGKPLGSIGHLAAFSFHETKNIIAGEGGLLAINDNQFVDRAEVLWEKGTNRWSCIKSFGSCNSIWICYINGG